MNHWGRPRVCARGCRRTSEPKMKAGDTQPTRQTVSCHMLGLYNKEMGEKQEAAIQGNERRKGGKKLNTRIKRRLVIHLMYHLLASKDHQNKGGDNTLAEPAAIYMFYACVGGPFACVCVFC